MEIALAIIKGSPYRVDVVCQVHQYPFLELCSVLSEGSQITLTAIGSIVFAGLYAHLQNNQ